MQIHTHTHTHTIFVCACVSACVFVYDLTLDMGFFAKKIVEDGILPSSPYVARWTDVSDWPVYTAADTSNSSRACLPALPPPPCIPTPCCPHVSASYIAPTTKCQEGGSTTAKIQVWESMLVVRYRGFPHPRRTAIKPSNQTCAQD